MSQSYSSALASVWRASGLELGQTPAKSSLSEARAKVSHRFFEDIYRADLKQMKRKTFRGLYVYAVDGDQFDLPASNEIIQAGYRGYPTSRARETHYPKMYTCQALDLVNGAITDFRFSPTQDESMLAREMALDFEKNSLAIYDRLHCGLQTFLAHYQSENYFLVRIRDTGKVANVVGAFLSSKKRSQWVQWPVTGRNHGKFPQPWVRLVKFRNPRSGRELALVTNLPNTQFSVRELAELYSRRWEIETSFRDLTATLNLESWHSKKLNGILQEIFAALWLVNQVRLWLSAKMRIKFLSREYKKPNFKLCIQLLFSHLPLLLARENRRLHEVLNYWFTRSCERRTRLSRSYARALKKRGRTYALNNVVPRRRSSLTERH